MNKTSLLLLPLALTASALIAANPAGVGPEAARESVKKFTVADGLEASLFASEPMVHNPTDMDIDERGRVWITEGVNYRSTFQKWGVLQPAGDRIVILDDTNGDGKADKRELLFTGIKGRDHDHAVHAFVFGPDGKLYFNFGNEGKELHYP